MCKTAFWLIKYKAVLQVEDSELADVAAVSAGNDYEIGNLIAEAMSKVGRKGVVTLEVGKSAENSINVVEGMLFERGYLSPYFVTDAEKMIVEYENCKVITVCLLKVVYPTWHEDLVFTLCFANIICAVASS